MNNSSDHRKSRNDFPLNSVLIGTTSFIVGLFMSIYFTVSEDRELSETLVMIGFAAVISLAAWRLIEFIKRA